MLDKRETSVALGILATSLDGSEGTFVAARG